MGLRIKTYQLRVFAYFFAAFAFFTVSVLVFQFRREKNYRTDQLETSLNDIAGFTDRYIANYNLHENGDFHQLDSITPLISTESSVRITVIQASGEVVYDSFVPDYEHMENHLLRPEIQKALYSDIGSNIRYSATTHQDFYYFARNFDDYFVRCAAVYNIEVKNFLKTERIFLFFMLALFLVMWGLLSLVTKRLGDFVNKLRDFAVKAGNNEEIDPGMKFMDSEFGDIQKQIVQIYGNLKNATEELTAEKERLLNHLTALNEGIAFFTHGKEKILANSNFIQFINLISEHSTISAESFFEIKDLAPLIQDIDSTLDPEKEINPKTPPQFRMTISKNEKYYEVQAIVFADQSFEILISDVTKPEKRRLLKQQLTSNIAHELKTPLTSIKGYLETISNNPDLPREKLLYFTDKAYVQSNRLNDLLNDTSLLNNIEDAGDLFEFKVTKLKPLVNDVIENLESRLNEQNIKVKLEMKNGVSLKGNDSLLTSIFQNLIENSIIYAGKDIEIIINQYLEDNKFYYFSFSDSGKGIPEKHLQRIFERFYRVDEGRTRESGGTGLGLAIVKNAILLHKGEISVRNANDGGLEFLFSLAKQ